MTEDTKGPFGGIMAKHSVYISEKSEKVISFLSDEKFHGRKNYSGSINLGLNLLDQLMKDKPELSEQEWSVIYNTYAGSAIEFDLPIRIPSDIMDNLGVYDVSKMDEETAGLIEKTSRMSQFEQVSVLWAVKQFWQAV